MGYFLDCVLAILLHELAHLVFAISLGMRVKRVGISWMGPYIVREQGPPFASLCVALAGPILNLILALTCWASAPEFAIVNLALGLSNVLPFIPGCDGQHALAAIRRMTASAAPQCH
jgi:Zn-dependent protease